MREKQISVFVQQSTWKVQNIMGIEVDFEWAVKLNRITLNMLGLWPKTARSSREKLICNFRVFVAFFGIMFCILIPAIHSLIRIYGDLMLMIDNLNFTLPATSSALRIAIFWWKKETIIPIINMIEKDWTKSKSMQERNIMIKKAQTLRIIVSCAYFIIGIACFFIVIPPIFGVSMRFASNITDIGRPILLQSYYIYDVSKSPLYELTFISQAAFISLGIMTYTGIDNFLGLLIFHISGQLDILKDRLIQFDKCSNSDMLKICVIEHVRLLRAIAIIEDTYNVTLLALFTYFAILFAFYGFWIIYIFNNGNNVSLIFLICFICIILNLLGHMCLYCALGEFLMIQCNEMYYAAYNNKWYSVNPKVTQDLLLLITRGVKPTYLTAGKIFPLTMSTFCSLVKTSAGYISILLTTKM
ncbi:odorant receptor 22c [Monomorium pharaonis]|uniref:odorant receptor 22c n=1 Tax=Monomorium pharaonis TaxID=307658 RepID=UPI0017470D6E|nr:odorant receptor 22c [Monomorium pharaonis]